MWRVKTYEELGNRRPSQWNRSGYMDYLYGQPIPEDKWEFLEQNKIILIPNTNQKYNYTGCWRITPNECIKIDSEPDYEIY